MLGICKYLCTKEGSDIIRDDLNGLVMKVCVIDSEVSIEPLDVIDLTLKDSSSDDKEL